MPRVNVACNMCMDVEVYSGEIKVCVAVNEDNEWLSDDSYYEFRCSGCKRTIRKPLDRYSLKYLRSKGVSNDQITFNRPTRRNNKCIEEPEPWVGTIPPQTHPENPPNGKPITHDDILDMHLLLEKEGWFEQLKTETSR